MASSFTVYDATRLHVSDLFNAQAAQATYQRLVDVINQQAAHVEQLLRRVATLEATQKAMVTAQQETLQHVDLAVGQLERLQSTHNRLQAERRSQQQEIDALRGQASGHSARMEEALARLDRLEARVDDNIQQQHMLFASADSVSHLHDAQRLVEDRVMSIQTQVNQKLDKSEVSRLESTVAKINAFAPTANLLTSQLTEVKAMQQKLGDELSYQAVKLGTAVHEIDQVNVRLEGKLDTVAWREFYTNEYQSTTSATKAENTKLLAAVNELVHRGVSLDTSYRTLSSKLASVAASLLDQVLSTRKDLETKVETNVTRVQLEALLKPVNQELSCKAWRQDTQALTQNVAALSIKLDEVQQRATLSTRFIEWFAARGEAYERNLDVVEDHLGRLAEASAPQRREPFGSRVRYQ